VEFTGDDQNPKASEVWKVGGQLLSFPSRQLGAYNRITIAPISMVVIVVALAIAFSIVYSWQESWRRSKLVIKDLYSRCMQSVKAWRQTDDQPGDTQA